MIDFIKAYFTDMHIAARLRNTICTQVEVDHSTGDISLGEHFGKCSQFKIKVYPSGRVQLKGSLHKYYHGGLNDNDFTLSQAKQAIFSFCELIGIKPERVFLENLEFGVNILLSYPSSILLSNIISTSNGKMFSPMAGEGLNCKLSEYRHKAYNKSSRYSNNEWLLRYEIHVDKMRWIYPVKTLQDLLNTEIWDLLQNKLVKQFRQIVFTDMYNTDCFSKKENTFYDKYRDKINNQRFWSEIKAIERHRVHKHLRKLQLKGTYQFSDLISNEIREKVEELKNLQLFHHSNTG